MSSRLQATKAAAHHRKVQEASSAKNLGNKFTQKQSKFAIMNEEKQLAALANGGDAAPLRGGRRGSFRQEAPPVVVPQPPKPSAIAVAAEAGYNPFSPIVRKSKVTKPSASSSSGAPVHPGFTAQPHRVVPQSAANSLNRKSSKFALDQSAAGGKRGRGDDSGDDGGANNSGGLGALLGGRVTRQEDVEAAAAAAEDDGPDAKKNKFERFQELIDTTRNERAQNHRDKLEKERQTTFLDTEFESIMGLLHRRDKIEEEKVAFKASITPDIQSLLDKYRPAGRVAKKLDLGASAASDAPPTIAPLKDPSEKKKAGLAPDSQKLLASINAKARDGRAPKEIAAMPLAVSEEVQRAVARQEEQRIASRQPQKGYAMASLIDDNAAIGFGDDDDNAAAGLVGAHSSTRKVDEFDLLMGRMRNESSRMAVATDRVLSEEELEAQRLRMLELEEDRAVAPKVSVEQQDMSRKEWLLRGGDLAHTMDAVDAEEEDLDYDQNYDEEVVYSDADDADATDAADAEAAAEDEGDDEEKGAAGKKGAAGLHVVDELLAAIETKCKEHCNRLHRKKTIFEQLEESRMFKQQIVDLSGSLHEACRRNPHYGVESLRLILVSMQKRALAAASAASNKSLEDVMTPFHLVLLTIMLNIFPVSDFRHEVVTPLFLFLSATIVQARLRTLNDARIVLCLSSLLADGLARGGQRFAAEPLIGALNVFALQLSRSEVEPERLQGTRLPCPMLSRAEEAVLALTRSHRVATSTADEAMGEAERALPPLVSLTDAMASLADNAAAKKGSSSASASNPFDFLGPKQTAAAKAAAADAADAEESARLSIITSTIKLLLFIVGHFVKNNAGATASVCDPILAVDGLLSEGNKGKGIVARYPTNVANLYDDLMAKVAEARKGTMSFRTPLAMRTFRPRPIRQFEPLLAEMEAVEVQEHKHLKKVLREDRKRLVRNIQAQATVDRKGREREAAIDDARRTEKYNQLMGELQQQQHIMKTVDSYMVKAKSKSRKNPDGASKITKKDNEPDEL